MKSLFTFVLPFAFVSSIAFAEKLTQEQKDQLVAKGKTRSEEVYKAMEKINEVRKTKNFITDCKVVDHSNYYELSCDVSDYHESWGWSEGYHIIYRVDERDLTIKIDNMELREH